MYNYKHWSIALLLAFLMISEGFAQTSERVKEIRKMYADAQTYLAEETTTYVKTSIQRNEAAVGHVQYEMSYYPLTVIDNNFVRTKRKCCNNDAVGEILYEAGKPAFYFLRDKRYEEVYEIRVYWNKKGEVDTFLFQQVLAGGKKINVKYTDEEYTQTTSGAYTTAKKIYEIGSTAYSAYLDSLPNYAPEEP